MGRRGAPVAGTGYSTLAVDGMDQCAKILESVEDGKLSDIDFLELMACTGGCVGGPLTVNNPAIARHTIFLRERLLNERHLPGGDAAGEAARTGQGERCFRTSQFTARPALLLDPDYQKAMIMMEEMEVISEGLPGLDCGCCGAPNCHALAEDIVRGNASRTDCVIILKEQYRELLEKGSAG